VAVSVLRALRAVRDAPQHFLLSNVLRVAAGRVSPKRLVDLRPTRLWLDHTAVTDAIAIGLVLSLPSLVAMLGAQP